MGEWQAKESSVNGVLEDTDVFVPQAALSATFHCPKERVTESAIIIVTFTECLFCTKYLGKHCPCIILFNPSGNPVRLILL